MRLEQLEYLLAIQKYHSMTAAAEGLHVAQQSISTAIRALEVELTVPLVERSKKGSSLTTAGEEVASFAQELFSQWEEIMFKYVSQTFHGQKTREINLYVQANFLVSPDLAKLASHIKKYIPNAKVNINATDPENILNNITKDENSIGIFMVKEKEVNALKNIYNTFILDHHYVGFSVDINSNFIHAGDYSLRNLRNQNIFLMHEKNSPENMLQEIVEQYKLEEHNTVTYNVPSVVLGEYLKNDYGIFLGLFSADQLRNSTEYSRKILASENISRVNVALTKTDYLHYILQKTFLA